MQKNSIIPNEFETEFFYRLREKRIEERRRGKLRKTKMEEKEEKKRRRGNSGNSEE